MYERPFQLGTNLSCFYCCFRVQRHKENDILFKDIFISWVGSLFFLTTRLLYVFTFSLGGSTEPPEPPLDPPQQGGCLFQERGLLYVLASWRGACMEEGTYFQEGMC